MTASQPAARARLPAGPALPTASVMIPTLNGGATFERCLASLRRQEGVPIAETLVVDSGSTDGTVERARAAGAEVVEISRSEFSHGATRNRLAEMATGEALVMLVQDAVLADAGSLRALVGELAADPTLAAVTAQQVPGPDADVFSRFERFVHTGGGRSPAVAAESAEDDEQRPQAPGEACVDNVCVAIRRAAWEELRFRDVPFGEDLDFGARAVVSGWRTRVSKEATVLHHHDRDAGYTLARAAVHRLSELSLGAGDPPSSNRPLSLDRFLAGACEVVAEVEAAAQAELSGEDSVQLAPFLAGVHDRLGETPGAAPPRGELALLATLLDGSDSGQAFPNRARAELVQILSWTPLAAFAASVGEPVTSDAAHTFLSRLAGSKWGRALGELLYHHPDPGLEERLQAVVLEGSTPGVSRYDGFRVA